MTILLTLDLATVAGFAVGPIGPDPRAKSTPLFPAATVKPASGARRIAEAGASVGKFLSNGDDWLNELVDTYDPGAMAFEAPILPMKFDPAIKRMVPMTTVETLRKLYGLAGVAEMVAARRGIPWVREVRQQQYAKHFTGDGRVLGAKDRIQAECRRRGWVFKTDDEADALAMHDYAAALWWKENRGSRAA